MTIPMPRLDRAACSGTEPGPAVCRRCWDRPECLAWALASETNGFWGGYPAPGLAALRREFGIPTPDARRL